MIHGSPIHATPEEMARFLVRRKSSAREINLAVRSTFGCSPSLKSIAAMRGHYVRTRPDIDKLNRQSRYEALRRHRLPIIIANYERKLADARREAERLGVRL